MAIDTPIAQWRSFPSVKPTPCPLCPPLVLYTRSPRIARLRSRVKARAGAGDGQHLPLPISSGRLLAYRDAFIVLPRGGAPSQMAT